MNTPKLAHRQFTPNYAVPPGESLVELLDSIGLSQADLAERTGRPKKTINEIAKGKAAITPETALQLERVLGLPSSYWNALEQNYRAALARIEERHRLSQHVNWLSDFPVKEMIKRKWINERAEKVDLVEELLTFFGVASPDAWKDLWFRGKEATAFRKSSNHDAAELALTATWLRKGELNGRDVKCQSFDAARFKDVLSEIRGLTAHEDINAAIKSTIDACASAGVAVVLIPEFPKLGICGATRWLSTDKALIQLSLHYKRADQLWFSFFHEAGHILLHGKRDIFVEQKKGNQDLQEVEADAFASDFLIPSDQYKKFISLRDFSLAAISSFAKSLNIAPGIVVGRLQHDKHIGYQIGTNLFVRIGWAQ
ncbi:XRE family transcriptional regulator [Herbaspirillum rubrisubalbicans Os34]|uniref:XRE family transcriptional regulator n=1 Tax=Herbaspirillum rubrisubalbicans Os34 TaxID=1235827 RepID=A0A6M3ZJC3_9BURK|nr:helix-turn-helix domain-containing protein [Herbaspirillum rubrisubalbicans]QJP98784.1 XRE family transcriptional regulator [Herbaspirillum rubrisubalbicans Os34]